MNGNFILHPWYTLSCISLMMMIIVWSYNLEIGHISMNFAYAFIEDLMPTTSKDWCRKDLWCWKFPHKIKCFSWMCINDKVSTWENILKRGCVDPSIFQLCWCESESIAHLLVDTRFGKAVWRIGTSSLGFVFHWEDITLHGNMKGWIRAGPNSIHLPRHLLLDYLVDKE